MMEEVIKQGQNADRDKSWTVALDIEALTQSTDKSSGTKALSRKGSSRMERRIGDEQESEEATTWNTPKAINSQMEALKQQLNLLPNTLITNNPCSIVDSNGSNADGRGRRFNRFTALHPRKIPLIFASLSSMGTIILIYFTLAINRRGGA